MAEGVANRDWAGRGGAARILELGSTACVCLYVESSPNRSHLYRGSEAAGLLWGQQAAGGCDLLVGLHC